MKRSLCLTSALVVSLFAAGALFGDDPKADKDSKEATPAKQETKAKAGKALPGGFNKLGLSDEQRKKFFAIQAEYKAKRESLQKQLAELRETEKEEIAKILTDEQKVELKKILATRVLGEKEGKTPVSGKAKEER